LRAHPAIREAVVVQRQNKSGETHLLGYFTSRGAGPSVGELRGFLTQKLADYMIPSAFVMLENIPLTSNGKVDRTALPDPKQSRPDLAPAWKAPKTSTERQLVKIWEDILEIYPVGVNDDFFELGGHSLLGARLISRLHEALEVDLPLRVLFDSPTVALLAKRIDGACEASQNPQGDPDAGLITLHRAPGDKRIFCFPYRGGFRDEYFNFTRISRHATRDYSFFGLESRDLEPEGQPRRTIEEIGTDCREAMQRLQPHGPYCLVGECGGGILAHEVAQQLQDRGEKVQLLVLLDTHAWSFGTYIWRRMNENRLYRRRFNLKRERYRMPWVWTYFASRTKLHLKAFRQLKGAQRWRYLLDKTAHSVTSLPHSLQRQTSPSSQPSIPGRTEHRSDDLDPAEKAYYLASHRHRFRRYDGKIVLLVNEEWYANDPTLGWDKFAAGGLDVYQIPGNHDSCIPENIPLVSKLLHECLERANNELK
jgi:thioesterase domain-containing protein